MERLAPKPVLDSLSDRTRYLLERRLTPERNLSPYLEVFKFIRIRGLKPSIQYVTYTTHNVRWELETIYEVSAEEEQTDWVIHMKRRLDNLTQEDRQLRATQESSWCVWEDAFMSASPHIPQLLPFSTYRDYMNNTQAHILAYACLNRKFHDLKLFNSNFISINFQTNQQMYEGNLLAQTPIMILLGSSELHEFVESLLLRLPPDQQLRACPINYWQPSWSILMNQVVIDEERLQEFIYNCRREEGFFSKFLQLVHYDIDATTSLFAAGYKLCDKHIRNYNYKITAAITGAIINEPDWHNLNYLVSLNEEAAFTSITFFNSNKQIIKLRCGLIKEEIIAKALHPDRIDKLMRMGYDFVDLIDNHI